MNIFAIVGSASTPSSNLHLVRYVSGLLEPHCTVTIFDRLKELPHFDPQLSVSETPQPVLDFREAIAQADGVLFCTPEYVFSIPSGLKNALEWCVSTTIFSQKPVGIITASAHGVQGHEELQRILRTIYAQVYTPATLLIQGIKGKVSETGSITDQATIEKLTAFAEAFAGFVQKESRIQTGV